jgi:AbrB family looped-hinge helix DNA binding protein
MRITQRGQMTIPAAIRRKLGLKVGGEVTIREADGRVVMEAPRFTFESLRGSVKARQPVKDVEAAIRQAKQDKVRREARLYGR